jgi:hypothetical protein
MNFDDEFGFDGTGEAACVGVAEEGTGVDYKVTSFNCGLYAGEGDDTVVYTHVRRMILIQDTLCNVGREGLLSALLERSVPGTW